MPEIRALTLHQPWASLIAWGVKSYETRPRPLSYRGPLAIHAAKVWTRAHRGIHLQQVRYHTYDDPRGYEGRSVDPPLGAVVAIADMTDCLLMAQDPHPLAPGLIDVLHVGDDERFCGDWTPGRYAYRLENVRRLEQPIPAKGKQGLWRIDLPKVVLCG